MFITFNRSHVRLAVMVSILLLSLLLSTGLAGASGREWKEGMEWRDTSVLSLPSASRTVSYAYDDAGRLVRASYGDGKSIVYAYDNAGNLLRRRVLTADYTPDGIVIVDEIMQIARRWGASPGNPLYEAAYDPDGDGTIDAADIQQAAEQWHRRL
jgi:YD repeat-containing protein